MALFGYLVAHANSMSILVFIFYKFFINMAFCRSFFNGLADNYFNQLYKLNLKTFNWERISSDGDKWPSPRDKSSGISVSIKSFQSLISTF